MIMPWVWLLIVLNPIQAKDPLEQYRAAAIAQWEDDIQELEKLDKEQTDPDHAVLFIGSSSIRLWKDIAQDMAPYATVRRGYGGAKFSDFAVFVDRLVKSHRFDAVAVFVANDISGSNNDKTPVEVLRLVDIAVCKIQAYDPTAPVFLIAITPTPSRFGVWDKIKQVNALMAEYCHEHEGVVFVDTASSYLNADGKPIEDYFVEDHLHQNSKGYQLWAQIIKAALEPVLNK
ncbi:MAG: GDSL-type esterase/lipase family protein [Aureliella sp.]